MLSLSSATLLALVAAYMSFTFTAGRDLVEQGSQQQRPSPDRRSSKLWTNWPACTLTIDVVPIAALLASAALVWAYWRWARGRVFLLDFACYRAPRSLYVTLDQFLWGTAKLWQVDGAIPPDAAENIAFQRRISQRNGLGAETAVPPALHLDPPAASLEAAREEAQMVLFDAAREVFERTGLRPRDVDFLVVNCSLFCPTPSLSAMVVNHFRMRSDCLTYNLAGMGCSAGIISVDLARRLLQHSPGKIALVLSTENITQNWYRGNDRSMLIPNTLFRMGGAAAVLTSRASLRGRAKYELKHVVRVHLGADDTAYGCVFQEEDADGTVGVRLTKDIVGVASRALQANLTRLAPRVLPWGELAAYAWDWGLRRAGRRRGPAYQPDFRRAFQHFCLHAGGRGVIEGLGGQLRLTRANLEPSFSSLYYFGNTSSASYWYSFGYAESKQGMRKGDRVWQVGFGSGFKTNSAVWVALRSFRDDSHTAWADVTPADTARMWADLEGMGCRFEGGVLAPHRPTPKAAPGKEGKSVGAAS